VQAAGHGIQTLVDSTENTNSLQDPSAKYYDIVGFDPRGVGRTEPAARCMPDAASWWSWQLRTSSQGVLGSSDAALGRLWSMTHAWGNSCRNFTDSHDGPDIKRYMTTASVARDMLEIVEKHAEYVAARTNPHIKQSELVIHRKNAKLQYWGFSYGTYLGYSFAAMFPDRVGRLVLDSVVNSDDYNRIEGNGSLHDTERAMASFYTYCLQSGSEACPLASSTASIDELQSRVQNITQSLYHNPLAVPSEKGPEVLTYSDIRLLTFLSLYNPPDSFPRLAKILSAIEAGDGETLASQKWNFGIPHIYQCPISASEYDGDVPEFAILCADGEDVTGGDLKSFEEYWKEVERTSPSAGAIWSMSRLKCMGWKIRYVTIFYCALLYRFIFHNHSHLYHYTLRSTRSTLPCGKEYTDTTPIGPSIDTLAISAQKLRTPSSSSPIPQTPSHP
jgi:pimeloyl-ACP methyl ester carboxylesterase